jgi:hypothetical protein
MYSTCDQEIRRLILFILIRLSQKKSTPSSVPLVLNLHVGIEMHLFNEHLSRSRSHPLIFIKLIWLLSHSCPFLGVFIFVF